MTVFLYQEEEYCLFLSEYEVPIGESIEKDAEKQEEYMKEIKGVDKEKAQ